MMVKNHKLKQSHALDKTRLKQIKISNDRVAHEMRTPLSTIIVIVSLLLRRQCGEMSRERARSYYKKIYFLAKLMLHFVNDLLDYSMIEKDHFVKKVFKFNPNHTFRRVNTMFKH